MHSDALALTREIANQSKWGRGEGWLGNIKEPLQSAKRPLLRRVRGIYSNSLNSSHYAQNREKQSYLGWSEKDRSLFKSKNYCCNQYLSDQPSFLKNRIYFWIMMIVFPYYSVAIVPKVFASMKSNITYMKHCYNIWVLLLCFRNYGHIFCAFLLCTKRIS